MDLEFKNKKIVELNKLIEETRLKHEAALSEIKVRV